MQTAWEDTCVLITIAQPKRQTKKPAHHPAGAGPGGTACIGSLECLGCLVQPHAQSPSYIETHLHALCGSCHYRWLPLYCECQGRSNEWQNFGTLTAFRSKAVACPQRPRIRELVHSDKTRFLFRIWERTPLWLV